MPKPQKTKQGIEVPILKRNGRIIGTSPTMDWALTMAQNLNRGLSKDEGVVTVEVGPLGDAEIQLRTQRLVDSKNNGNGIRTADSK